MYFKNTLMCKKNIVAQSKNGAILRYKLWI